LVKPEALAALRKMGEGHFSEAGVTPEGFMQNDLKLKEMLLCS
jgi:hypothetical protein